jgi:hypothetical protein
MTKPANVPDRKNKRRIAALRRMQAGGSKYNPGDPLRRVVIENTTMALHTHRPTFTKKTPRETWTPARKLRRKVT